MLCLTAVVAASALCTAAQGPGGGPGGMRGGMGMPGGGGRMGGAERNGLTSGGMASPGRGKMSSGTTHSSLGPTGRWWDDHKFAKSLGLNGDQQKRMDNIFQQNRDTLQQRYDAFTKAQARLDALKQNGNASETALFSEIDRAAQARAELEQAYTHMQLQLRGEMTADQIGKLDERH
ncbi:Spy/CpxP family protein refolding chaperone [Terriglobus roseus]|nr:hypothetical protein [Terriglobus roseus]